MDENNQLENQDFQEYPLPKVKWRKEFWLSFIPFLMGFISIFFPQLLSLEKYKYIRFTLGILLLTTPLFAPLTVWFIKWIRAGTNRINNYTNLLNTLRQTITHVSDYKESVFLFFRLFLKSLEPFEVIEAHFTENSYFVIVRRSFRFNLFEGDRFLIFDFKDKSFVGIFVIVNIHDDCYYALGQPGLDPLWAGYIREKGKVDFFPYMKAFYFTEGDNHDN